MALDELRARWLAALSVRGRCPRCASSCVWYNGIRWRTASLLDGERVVFVVDVPVRRLRCRDCRARWSHPPQGVTERGHYQGCVVARAVTRVALDGGARRADIAHEHGCHRRTLRRWLERVASIAEPARLARVLLAQSELPVVPALPAPRPSRSARLLTLAARAVAVLALLEALASLHGLEPPALAHARSLVRGDAPSSDPQRGAPSGL